MDEKTCHPCKKFIGLGKIGATLATNMSIAGTSVLGHDPYFDRSKLAEKPQWTWADQLSSISSSSSTTSSTTSHTLSDGRVLGPIIFTVLPNDAAVENVVFQQNLLDLLPQNAVHVSISTISTELAERLQKAHEEKGHFFISAPVFARPDGLARRDAYFPVAGDKMVVDEVVRPLLSMTVAEGKGEEKIRYFGPRAEQANVVKL